MSNSRDFVKGLIIGGLIGAAAGILFAPKSGKETREDISRKTQDLLSRAKEEYEAAVEKSKKAYESAVDKMKEFQTLARMKASDAGEKVEDLADKGMETIDATRGRLKKAIDAGVEAFKEEKEKA
jgi:gas vesicle protein